MLCCSSGDTHWIVDSEEETWRNHFEQEFTVFRALSLPDVDEDGIKDILVTHSGNQSKESEVCSLCSILCMLLVEPCL